VPTKTARKPTITVQLTPELADAFYTFVQKEQRSASNAAARLIQLGLSSTQKGEAVTWDAPPRKQRPVIVSGQ
jgi:hypothetical protein